MVIWFGQNRNNCKIFLDISVTFPFAIFPNFMQPPKHYSVFLQFCFFRLFRYFHGKKKFKLTIMVATHLQNAITRLSSSTHQHSAQFSCSVMSDFATP